MDKAARSSYDTAANGDDWQESESGTIEGITMRVRRRTRNVPVVLLAMVLTSFFHAGHSVWSVNIPHQAYIISVQPGLCMNLGGLTREQIDLCQKNIDHMASVGLGAKMAIQECQFQYQYEKWNCSIPDAEKSSLFERITSKDVVRVELLASATAATRNSYI